MADLLRMDYLNSLPHPLYAKKHGQWWPVVDIDVETGLFRIDACGMLDVLHIGGILWFMDESGKEHDTETFYSDYTPESEDGSK